MLVGFCVLNIYYIGEVKSNVRLDILDIQKDIDRLEDENMESNEIQKQLLRKGYYE